MNLGCQRPFVFTQATWRRAKAGPSGRQSIVIAIIQARTQAEAIRKFVQRTSVLR